MSKQREALEKAIDALAFIHKFSHTAIDQIDEIREALAEPEQKPVAVVTSLTGDPVTMSWHQEHMTFCLGNALKYVWRAGLKGDEIEDLRKAVWYIEREIARRTK
jgi:hypothetical protein